VRHPLPAGLRESDKLPEPIFTPSTKAQTGHDENISFERCARWSAKIWRAPARSHAEYLHARGGYAETRGIIIADTKFEFGFVDGELVLGDEVLTPDSSRFWPAETTARRPQFSYDKQFVRDYLESIHWNKQPPAPPLPEKSPRTSEKYRQAYQRSHRPEAMNWLDIVLLLVLAGSVVTSFRTGLTREVVGLAMYRWRWCWPSGSTARRGRTCSRTSVRRAANLGGFLMVFCGVLILGAIVGRVLGGFLKVGACRSSIGCWARVSALCAGC
jgi:hypothetical protein